MNVRLVAIASLFSLAIRFLLLLLLLLLFYVTCVCVKNRPGDSNWFRHGAHQQTKRAHIAIDHFRRIIARMHELNSVQTDDENDDRLH